MHVMIFLDNSIIPVMVFLDNSIIPVMVFLDYRIIPVKVFLDNSIIPTTVMRTGHWTERMLIKVLWEGGICTIVKGTVARELFLN